MVELNYSKKQLKSLIEKFNVDVENDGNFHEIIAMFDGQTNYHMWAMKLFWSCRRIITASGIPSLNTLSITMPISSKL